MDTSCKYYTAVLHSPSWSPQLSVQTIEAQRTKWYRPNKYPGQSSTYCYGSGRPPGLVSPCSCISLLSDHHLPLQPLAGHVYSATAVEKSQHPSNPKVQARGLLTPNLHYRNPRTEIQRKRNGYSQIYQFPFQIFPFPFRFRFFLFFSFQFPFSLTESKFFR